MTDTIRDLLISLASHMAYMQGQLEARHELDDPEDYYWYRESVLLRQKVTDTLADEPAVPEGMEPVAVTGQPSDQEGPSAEDVEELCEEHCFNVEGYESIECLQGLINEAIARWGNPAPVPPADGDVAELVADQPAFASWLAREMPPGTIIGDPYWWAPRIARHAAKLLQRQALVPVAVSERLPGDQLCWWFEADEDCGYGSTWTLLRIRGSATSYTHWLPAHALPLPTSGEGE